MSSQQISDLRVPHLPPGAPIGTSDSVLPENYKTMDFKRMPKQPKALSGRNEDKEEPARSQQQQEQ